MSDDPLTAAQIARLQALNARDQERDLEVTLEHSRLEFVRRLIATGRISQDDSPSETGIKDIGQTLDIAGTSCHADPHYSG